MPGLPELAIDEINQVWGYHPCCRAAHAKGTVCRGRFVATADARALTTAPHMQGDPVDVTVRFSNSAGDPKLPDSHRDLRGMATKFYLPDGRRTDILAVTLPSFPARTPHDFIEFTQSTVPNYRTGRLRPLDLLRYLSRHRRGLRPVFSAGTQKLPASYATCRYNALHAYRWVDAGGTRQPVRYSWIPEAGEANIGSREARRRGPDYLTQEILTRLSPEDTVRFKLELQLGIEGRDPVDDVTAIWPSRRKTMFAGTLELYGPDLERETGDDVLFFDPTNVVEGIELTDDPILRFRGEAYPVSVERRTAVPRPDRVHV